MKNWTHKIIRELHKRYTEIPSELSRFAKDTLLIPKDDMAGARNFVEILNELEKEGYITWNACTITWDEDGKEIFGEN